MCERCFEQVLIRVNGNLSRCLHCGNTISIQCLHRVCKHCVNVYSATLAVCVGPPAPCAPPKAHPPSLLSPSAPPFTPSNLQPPQPSSLPLPHPSPPLSGAPSLSSGKATFLVPNPTKKCASSSAHGSSPDPLTSRLLPHALFSYEELRWQHMSSRSSQQRRATSPPPLPPPSAAPPPFVVGCVRNERPPPPAPTRGRERGPRSWDFRRRFAESLSRSRSSGGQEDGE